MKKLKLLIKIINNNNIYRDLVLKIRVFNI